MHIHDDVHMYIYIYTHRYTYIHTGALLYSFNAVILCYVSVYSAFITIFFVLYVCRTYLYESNDSAVNGNISVTPDSGSSATIKYKHTHTHP